MDIDSGSSHKPGIIPRVAGWALSLAMAVATWEASWNIAQVTSYSAAKRYYDAQPQGPFDPSPHLRALAFSLHRGAENGAWCGVIVCYLAYLATRHKCGWWSLAIGLVSGLVAAALGGYWTSVSP